MWRTKRGDEKLQKYFTINRRKVPACQDYRPTGEVGTLLEDLRRTLPKCDEVYSYGEGEIEATSTGPTLSPNRMNPAMELIHGNHQ